MIHSGAPGPTVRGPIIRGPICLEHKNVLAEYQDRLKNVFTHSIIDFSASPIHSKTAPRNMFPASQMFGTNIRLDLLKIYMVLGKLGPG